MKFSTIGTSWITESFIKAAEITGAAELTSVYSRTAKKAEQFANKHGASSWYTDLQDMLSSESDFVYIASPNSLHYEQILACIDHGKHVFCEKPMGYTEQQINDITEQAEANQVYVMEGYRHLFSPNYKALKDHLDNVGQVRSTLLQYVQYSSRYDAFKAGETPNVFSKDFAGGALMDLGVYPLSMAIDLFGEPQDVNYYPVYLSNGTDGSGTLILSYQEHQVTIMCSKIAQATVPSEIHGEDGTLTMDHMAPIQRLTLTERGEKEGKELAIKQADVDMVYELEAFQKMIQQADKTSHQQRLERSRLVAKWSEKARNKANLFILNESHE